MVFCSPPQPLWDITIHPLWGQHPRWYSFLSLIDVGLPPNPPPLGPSVLTGTPPRVYIRGTTRRLAHRPMSGSNTICNDPNPPLADIVLFGLPLSSFPFKTCLLGEGFHTRIKGVLFSSTINVGHHNLSGKNEQYLLAVGLDHYKQYQIQIPGSVSARTLGFWSQSILYKVKT